MPDGQAFYDAWFAEHARCETCLHVRRNLFGLECGHVESEGMSVEPDFLCGSRWDPFGDFAPALEAVIEKSLEMDCEGYLNG